MSSHLTTASSRPTLALRAPARRPVAALRGSFVSSSLRSTTALPRYCCLVAVVRLDDRASALLLPAFPPVSLSPPQPSTVASALHGRSCLWIVALALQSQGSYLCLRNAGEGVTVEAQSSASMEHDNGVTAQAQLFTLLKRIGRGAVQTHFFSEVALTLLSLWGAHVSKAQTLQLMLVE